MFKSKIIKRNNLQPLKRFNLDAAIIFSDILLIPYALGQKLNLKKILDQGLDDLNIIIYLNDRRRYCIKIKSYL